MKTFRRMALVMLLAAVSLVGLNSTSYANFQLKISDGSTTKTITDDSAEDLAKLPGGIYWSGTVGSWKVFQVVGLRYPITGSQSDPSMDLNVDAFFSGPTPGSLKIFLSETGFTTGPGSAVLAVGGTLNNAALKVEDSWDSNDMFFGIASPISTLGPFTTSAYSGAASGFVAGDPSYSLTILGTITSNGSGHAGFDASLTLAGTPVPEPGTLPLFGFALFGLGLYGGWRRKKEND